LHPHGTELRVSRKVTPRNSANSNIHTRRANSTYAVLSTVGAGVTSLRTLLRRLQSPLTRKMQSLNEGSRFLYTIPDKLHGVTCGKTVMSMYRKVRKSANLHTLSYQILLLYRNLKRTELPTCAVANGAPLAYSTWFAVLPIAPLRRMFGL
jgi:hypothetical protein